MVDITSREAGIVDPDSLPLALPQETDCGYHHGSFVRPTQANGEWARCPACKTPLEPKMATGALTGPMFGIGRGWVSPRAKRRWEAIAFRFAGRFG